MSTSLATLTPEQRDAIATRDVSIALSAGAGCGKTFVLTERFLSHLEPGKAAPPAELHELIAITFTDRAAREMRDRIRRKCYERLQHAQADDSGYWLKLLRSLDRARISTIHSFCGSLLRSHAVEAKLDPRFVVVEPSQAETLLAEIIDDVLREQLVEHDESLLALVTEFGLDRIRSMVSDLLGAARSIDFAHWLSRTPEQAVDVWAQFHRETMIPWALGQAANSPAARELLEVVCLLGEANGELKARCEALSRLLPAIANSSQPLADLDAIVEHARIQGVSSKKLWPDESLKDRFKLAAERVRAEARAAKELLAFDPQAARVDAEAGLQVLRLVHRAHQRYHERKRELAWLDFDDLLAEAHGLLTDPAHQALQKRLAGETRLLLVDECQDTDPLQVALIKALCGGKPRDGKLFFVGDYKQSIYRFRGADPAVFRQLRSETPKKGRLPLSKNFRSQPAILDFVNALFHDVPLGGDDPSLTYEPLLAHHAQLTPVPAVEFLWTIAADLQKNASGARAEARRREAESIARRIRAMLDAREMLVRSEEGGGPPRLRAVEMKDIALLFRALSDVQLYEEALRKYGIDYYLVGGHAFYSQQEIYDVVNLLRALASPADEVALAGALRSPMFALSDESLFWLAQHPQGLAAGLHARPIAGEIAGDQRERIQFASQTLHGLRSKKDRLPIAGLLNEAFRLTGYDAALLGDFLGQRKLANLRKLVEQARAFDQSEALGLADFIVQLSEFIVNQPREPLAATHPEGTDVVRLMTIHQAKGLEFPVVFVPDLNRTSHGRDGDAQWHAQLGPLVKVPRTEGEEARTSGLDFTRALAKAEDEAERHRLLYVAATRAADYLVFSSGMFDLEAPDGPWTKLLAEHFDLTTGDVLGNLPAGFGRPEVQVVTELPNVEARGAKGRVDLKKTLRAAKQASTGKANRAGGHFSAVEPIEPDPAAQRRFSVSRLSGQLEEADVPLADVERDELAWAGPAGADFGTLVHRALAQLDFQEADLAATLALAARDADDDALQHAQTLLEQFLESPRGRQIAAAARSAGRVHRELEFLLAWPPQDATAAGNASDRSPPIFLQGFIDCLYQADDGGWRLVDYKTNQANLESIPQLVERYRLQMGVYALAVEQISGEAPRELVLNFLRPGLEHALTWNAELRQETIDRVGSQIAKMVGQAASC